MASPILRRNLIYVFPNKNPLKSNFCFSLYFSTKEICSAATVTQFLINKHHFSPDAASRMASLTRIKSLENADSLLSFLKHTGFSHAQLLSIAKSSPRLFTAHLDSKIKPKFQIFHELGFTSPEIVGIVSRQSRILNLSAPQLLSSVTAVKTLLRSNAAVAKFLTVRKMSFKDMDTILLRNVELLKSCGVSMDQIISVMVDVRFVLSKPEQMKKFVEKADELGCDRGSGRFVHAVRAVGSMNNKTWGLKLQTMRQLGFSEDDIVRTFRNSPKVLSTSSEKMKRVAKVLTESGRYDILSIASTPVVFSYSIENRIKPRLRILRLLESKNLIRRWPSLATMVVLSDGRFFRNFVSPYLDDDCELRRAVSGMGKVKLEKMQII